MGALGHGDWLAAHFADGQRPAGEAAGSGDAERHDRVRLNQGALEFEPDFAALDFVIVGTFMQTLLAKHLMLEVLHGVGDEGLRPRDAGVLQRLIEEPAGRPDKWPTGEVFLVARLFTDQHERSVARPLAGHRLSGIAIKRTARATSLRFC